VPSMRPRGQESPPSPKGVLWAILFFLFSAAFWVCFVVTLRDFIGGEKSEIFPVIVWGLFAGILTAVGIKYLILWERGEPVPERLDKTWSDIRDPTKRKESAIGLIVFNAISWTFFIWAIHLCVSRNKTIPEWRWADDIAILAITGFLAGLTTFGAVWFVANLILGSRLGLHRLSLDPERIPLGGTLRANLTLSAWRKITIREIKMTLRCLELTQASGNDGDSSGLKNAVIYEKEEVLAKGLDLKAGERYDFAGEFQIPEDAMHTFGSSSNAVQWSITTRVRLPHSPPYIETREVTVLPQVRRI